MAKAHARADQCTIERQILERGCGLHATTRVIRVQRARKAGAEVMMMPGPRIMSKRIQQPLEPAYRAQVTSIKSVGAPGLPCQAVALCRSDVDVPSYRIRTPGKGSLSLCQPQGIDDGVGIRCQQKRPSLRSCERVRCAAQTQCGLLHQQAACATHVCVMLMKRVLHHMQMHVHMSRGESPCHLRRRIGAVIEQKQNFIPFAVNRFAAERLLSIKSLKTLLQALLFVANGDHDGHTATWP